MATSVHCLKKKELSAHQLNVWVRLFRDSTTPLQLHTDVLIALIVDVLFLPNLLSLPSLCFFCWFLSMVLNNLSNEFVMCGSMMLCSIKSLVFFTQSPAKAKVLLLFAVTKPVSLHVHCFCCMQDSVVGDNSLGGQVVCLDHCWWLWVPHFGQGVLQFVASLLLRNGFIMSWRKGTKSSSWWENEVINTLKEPINLGLSCLSWSMRHMPLMRRIEIPSGEMPYNKKWKMWRLHSKSYLRARSHPIGFTMSSDVWCLTLKWRISGERHA